MSVISTVEAVPNRMKMLYAYLERGSGEDRERLIGIVGPKALRRRSAADGDAAGSSGPASKTVVEPLNEALAMGLLREEDGRIIAGSPLDPARRRSGFDRAYIEHVERLLLDAAAPGADSQRAFGYALAWLLLRSPYRPLEFSSNPRKPVQDQLGEGDEYEMTSPPRWQNLCYWGRSLGYCTFTASVLGKTLVVADPTDALRRHLRDLFRERRELPIVELIRELARRSPVFEEGSYRTAVEDRLTTPRDPVVLSESTSFALRRLERRNLIVWRTAADAEPRVLSFGEARERVTHISATGKL